MPYKDKKQQKQYSREYNRLWMRNKYLSDPIKANLEAAKWRESNPRSRLLSSTKATAKKRGIEHNIEIEDIILLLNCPLLGIPIDYTAGNGKTMEKPSIDRIDPNKGYIKGNIEVMSSLANTMKSRATPEQLVYFAKRILERYDK